MLVTGCYDWFHSGHVRFFEEVSELGDLYVVVGHDANVRALKGEGHPMFSQDERRYMAGAVRYVRQALVSTGHGWLDAEPELMRIKPDMYAVNEDGDKPEKEKFCREHGIDRFLIRAQDLLTLSGTLDIYAFAKSFSEAGMPATTRMAMVRSEKTTPNLRFVETVARNHGIQAKIFDSEEKALAWLST